MIFLEWPQLLKSRSQPQIQVKAVIFILFFCVKDILFRLRILCLSNIRYFLSLFIPRLKETRNNNFPQFSFIFQTLHSFYLLIQFLWSHMISRRASVDFSECTSRESWRTRTARPRLSSSRSTISEPITRASSDLQIILR